LQVYRCENLPRNLVALFEDSTVIFLGAYVGGDFAKIGRDLKCQPIIKNIAHIVNLGSYARKRDVVQNGTVTLDELVKIVLCETLEKNPTVRLSKWSVTKLTKAQIEYAALDAIKSLEVYVKLQQLPDLSLRLSKEDAIPGSIVDVVPSHGNVSSMATRAAWGTLVDDKYCRLPLNFTPSRVKRGASTRVVKIEHVTAPHLFVPGIKNSRGNHACLGDFGDPPFSILLPIKMMKKHIDDNSIRNTPPAHDHVDESTANVTEPAAILDMRLSQEEDCQDFDTSSETLETEIEIDDEAEFDDVVDEMSRDLTSEDIEHLKAITILSEAAAENRVVLKCEGLDDPPQASEIKDVFSSILGDGFHYIDRSKIPVKHEYKKTYKVALRNAWFAWNPSKLQSLKSAMKAGGLSEKEIEAEMYYNASFFKACIDRRVLPPRLLYWRVRAVYTALGNKLDSKTKQPRFWNLACGGRNV